MTNVTLIQGSREPSGYSAGVQTKRLVGSIPDKRSKLSPVDPGNNKSLEGWERYGEEMTSCIINNKASQTNKYKRNTFKPYNTVSLPTMEEVCGQVKLKFVHVGISRIKKKI